MEDVNPIKKSSETMNKISKFINKIFIIFLILSIISFVLPLIIHPIISTTAGLSFLGKFFTFYPSADWRLWVALIAGIVGFIFLIIFKFVKNPIVFIIYLIGFGLAIGFDIWIIVEKSNEFINSANTYFDEISQSISDNPDYQQIQQNVTQGQEQVEEQSNFIIEMWETISSMWG